LTRRHVRVLLAAIAEMAVESDDPRNPH